jgi:hypothetical protein
MYFTSVCLLLKTNYTSVDEVVCVGNVESNDVETFQRAALMSQKILQCFKNVAVAQKYKERASMVDLRHTEL